jgi:chromosome segregation ATPase
LQDAGTAKTLAFHKDVRTRCITLEGDDFNPGGTLTGDALLPCIATKSEAFRNAKSNGFTQLAQAFAASASAGKSLAPGKSLTHTVTRFVPAAAFPGLGGQ